MAKNLKIFWLDQGDFLGGAELFSLDVLKELKKSKNLKLTLLTHDLNSDFAEQASDLDLPLLQIPLPKLPPFHFIKFLKAVKKLKQLIKKHQPDIIHTNTARAHLIASFALRNSIKPKLTWMLHDFDFSPYFFKKFIKVPAKIGALPAVIEWAKTQVPKKFHDKFTPIQNGLDFKEINQIKSQKFTIKHSHSDTLKVGFLGRITPWKGPDIFTQAAFEILKQNPHTEFFIAGNIKPEDETFAKTLQTQIQKSPHSNRFHWLGWRDDNLHLINQFDILTHASTDPEPFGRTIIEAQALGTPVIASNLGGPKSIIQNNQNGILIPPKNPAFLIAALQKLISEPKLRAHLSLTSQKTAKANFTIQKVADSFSDMWSEIY